MSIKDEIRKMQKDEHKKAQKKVGNGLIKLEIKDGEIEATSYINMPADTLILTLTMLEVLQRSIVENEPELQNVFKLLRQVSDGALLKVINDNSSLVKEVKNESH